MDSVRALLIVTLAKLNFHIHIDRPDVHAFRIVRDDTLEHSATTFRVLVSEL